MREFGCCAVKTLPPHLELRAAWYAALARPANAPGLVDLVYSDPGRPVPPESITLLKGKFWPNGSTLRVAFKGGNPTANTAVLNHASVWSKWANIDFVGVAANTPWDILVGYDQPGYWSLVGTDSRFAAQQGRQSLNLQGFDEGMPESEWLRVVCHEFGHALGAMHEQMRPEVVARLDRAKVHAWLRQTQGWSDADIDAQMFDVLDMSQEVSSVEQDTSIMMYQIPASVTVDGVGIVGGDHVTDLDGLTMARVYPGRAPAPTPGVPPVITVPVGTPPVGVPPVGPAPVTPTGPPPGVTPDAVLDAVNEARAVHLVQALRADPRLAASAAGAAALSARLGLLTHAFFGWRVASAHASASAEDGERGAVTAQGVVNAWLGDPAHRTNMLAAGYNAAGVGVARGHDGMVYCFADFATL